MVSVCFDCDRKNINMFVLHFWKEMDYVPLVGDIIETNKNDFVKTTFRIKPWNKDKKYSNIKNCTNLNFRVVSRKYVTYDNQWLITCEPTVESLLYLLSKVKT